MGTDTIIAPTVTPFAKMAETALAAARRLRRALLASFTWLAAETGAIFLSAEIAGCIWPRILRSATVFGAPTAKTRINRSPRRHSQSAPTGRRQQMDGRSCEISNWRSVTGRVALRAI